MTNKVKPESEEKGTFETGAEDFLKVGQKAVLQATGYGWVSTVLSVTGLDNAMNKYHPIKQVGKLADRVMNRGQLKTAHSAVPTDIPAAVHAKPAPSPHAKPAIGEPV